MPGAWFVTSCLTHLLPVGKTYVGKTVLPAQGAARPFFQMDPEDDSLNP
jgi:hypothetical protein